MKSFLSLLICICLPMLVGAQFRDGLDVSFGVAGLAVRNFYPIPSSGDDDRFLDVLFEPNGKIIAIAGNSIVRMHPDGTPDSSFGRYAVVSDTFKKPDGTAYELQPLRLAMQSDGSLIVASVYNAAIWPGYTPQTVVSRVFADGHIDPSFGTRGSFTDTLLYRKRPNDIKVLQDDRIVVSGDTAYMPFLALLDPDGSLDHHFAGTGMLVDFSAYATGNAMLAIDTKGRIVQLRQHYSVARYWTDGTPDTGFNHTGKMLADFVPHAPTALLTSVSIATDSEDAIWIAGNSFYRSVEPFTLVKIDSSGRADSHFGSGGYEEYPWFSGSTNQVADLVLLRDGRILMAGTVQNPVTGQDNFGLMRVFRDGRADTGFGDHSRLLTQLEGRSVSPDKLYRAAELPDRKIMAFGTTCTGLPHIASAAARYHGNGKTAVPEMNAKDLGLQLFPNPAHNYLIVQSSATLPAGYVIRVVNIMGYAQLTFTASRSSKQRIDLSALSPGDYILQLLDEAKRPVFSAHFCKEQF